MASLDPLRIFWDTGESRIYTVLLADIFSAR